MLDVTWLSTTAASLLVSIAGYFIHQNNQKIAKLDEDKVERKEYQVQVIEMKDDIREIKDNVEYIRRKFEE